MTLEKQLKKIYRFQYFISIFIGICMGFIIIGNIAFVLTSYKRATENTDAPFLLMTSKGHSMEPNLHPDELLLINTKTSPQVGDIVVFKTYNEDVPLICHRVKGFEQTESGTKIITRGDNNDQDDEYDTTINDIVGVIKFNVHHAAILVDKDPIILLAIVVTLMLQMIVLTALIQHLQKDAQHIQARLNLQYRVRLAQYNYQQNYPNYA